MSRDVTSVEDHPIEFESPAAVVSSPDVGDRVGPIPCIYSSPDAPEMGPISMPTGVDSYPDAGDRVDPMP